MSKGYWVKQVEIPSADLFVEYLRTVVPWLISIGGKIVAKDIIQESSLTHWDGGKLGVVVEFESKNAAIKAYNSPDFQEYIKERGIKAGIMLTILDSFR
tara:strand:- start:103 stop:399 length:297 start_codon:yes stop_codon:yes gene_type:complete